MQLLLCSKAKGFLLDWVSSLKPRTCILTRLGFLLIYFEQSRGFVLNMRQCEEIFTQSDHLRTRRFQTVRLEGGGVSAPLSPQTPLRLRLAASLPEGPADGRVEGGAARRPGLSLPAHTPQVGDLLPEETEETGNEEVEEEKKDEEETLCVPRTAFEGKPRPMLCLEAPSGDEWSAQATDGSTGVRGWCCWVSRSGSHLLTRHRLLVLFA